jgi:GNAT superfamily N-acetyltransferase
MSDVIIRELSQDEDFGHWFHELIEFEGREAGHVGASEDRYLVLSNEIGDWIGGLRFSLRGGVAAVVELAVTPQERHHGHAHRLLEAFEASARDNAAHLAEFWTDDKDSEALLAAMGWTVVLRRDRYMADRSWVLMEKRF